MQTSSIRNNALHYLTFIKIILARCMGTDIFLIRYAEGHTKQTRRQLQKFLDYF
jgi:hypothetical protein